MLNDFSWHLPPIVGVRARWVKAAGTRSQRERLINAMMELCAERGYQVVSVAGVSSCTQVSLEPDHLAREAGRVLRGGAGGDSPGGGDHAAFTVFVEKGYGYSPRARALRGLVYVVIAPFTGPLEAADASALRARSKAEAQV